MSLNKFLTRLIWLCVLPLVLLAIYLAINHVNHLQNERNLEAEYLAQGLATAVDHDLNVRIDAASVRHEGKTDFVAVNAADISQLKYRLDQVKLPSGWSLALLNGQGEAITQRGSPGMNTAFVVDSARRFVVKSQASPLSVVLEIPRLIYLAPLVEAAAQLAIAILAATLVGVFGGKLAGRQLAKSVASLGEAPMTKAPAPNITEIAAVRRLLDETIDARDKIEAARRDSEQRFRSTFEQAATGIALIAPNGSWLHVNQKLCDIAGYTQDELLTKTFQDITHPDDLNADLTFVRQLLVGEIDTYTMEKRYFRKDGATVWVNLTVALVRQPDGRPDYFISVVEDIQRRKEVEAALRVKDNMLREAQRLAGLGNWSWDLRTNQHTRSEKIYRIFGLDPSLLPSENLEVRSYFTPDSWEHIEATLKTILAKGTPYEFDAEIVRADGVHRWISARGEATRDADGAVREIHGTVQDITERIRTKERLRVSDLALKAVSQGVVITSPDGCILSANDAFLSITGYSENEILGRTCGFVQGPLTDPQMVESIRRAQQNIMEFSGDLLNYCKDGTPFWNELSISPVCDEQGRLTHFIGVTRDITLRKLVEDELDQHRQHLEQLVLSRTAELAGARDDAESANRAKSAFLATMSHELRTPLNAVVGLTGLLADTPLGRRQRDYADKIQLSAQALRALIDDILDFSKIEAGKLQLEQASFSLSAILRTAAAVVGVGLRDKPIEALFDVAPDVPDALIGDALRLQQILLNLTSNAVKFTKAGVIVVSVRCLDRTAAQATLQFIVRDTGIGIPTEQLGPIFDGFSQADASTSRQYGGTGLGLTISTRLANLMGGQIEVGSTLGQGSEFRLEVPLALGIYEPPVTSEQIPSGLTILIIDDHPLARDILTQTCAAIGWQATALACGAAGLDELRLSAAQGRDYDLLLLDWRMPGMDGIEMLRQAYATPNIGLPLVVLMASIFELEQAVAASDDLYLDGIVAKPITPASLIEVVTRAYSGEFIGNLPLLGKTDRRLSGMRLLVAEDNELNREVIEQILMRAGAEVVMAVNGLAAVEALRVPGARFDAVLMDIQMPVMDGYTATRIIRENMGLIDLPIIAVTAFARPEDREKYRLSGMAGHIVKPIDVEDLLDIVAEKRQYSFDMFAESSGSAPQTMTSAINLPGLDIAAALKTFGGDGKKYRELLCKFVAQHGGDADEARRLFGAKDPKGATSLLHGLSGVAGLLQATRLAHLAAAAEGALLDGNSDVMPVLFDELEVAMHAVQESVSKFDATGS